MGVGLPVHRRSRRRQVSVSKYFTRFLALAAFVTGMYYVGMELWQYWQEKPILSVVAQVTEPEPTIPDSELYDIQIYTVVSGDTGFGVLEKNIPLPKDTLSQIVYDATDVYDLSLVKVDDEILFYFDKETGDWHKMVYEISTDETFVIEQLNNDEFSIRMDAVEYRTVKRGASGIIESSLYQSAVLEQGLSPKLIVDLAEIFAWDVDFTTDIRTGDSFKVFFDQKNRKDSEGYITGQIHAAQFVNDGRVYEAFYFVDSAGNGNYYNRDGESVEKTFLRSPIQYRYISSGYTNSRFHPILKKYLPHRSIDYVAPLGTPAVSIGSGTVSYVGYKGGWGMTVIVKHNDMYSTQYSHFGSYGEGISLGARVDQGQIVGYVGMTGFTTGPHLDFTFNKFGEPVNPDTIDFPSAEPVPDEERDAYFVQLEYLASQLDGIQ